MKSLHWMLVCILSLCVACDKTESSQELASESNAETETVFIVDVEPPGAMAVGEARGSAKDADELTLVGTIGGSTEPFVDGLAAFTIVDTKVPYCAAEEGCATPWDYCCEQDQVKDNIATVKLVDESGKPVALDAREMLGVKELSTVVVQGKAERDEQGNLVIAANRVYIRPGE